MGDFYPEQEGFDLVGCIDWRAGEGGYDWSQTRVWVKNREFFMYSDSGCSCNYFGQDMNRGDLEPLYGRLNAIKVMRAKAVGRHIQVIEDIDDLCAEIRKVG